MVDERLNGVQPSRPKADRAPEAKLYFRPRYAVAQGLSLDNGRVELADEKGTQVAIQFDSVLESHDDVYAAIQPFIADVLVGRSLTVLVFGGPGSGKSFTLGNDESGDGVVLRAVRRLHNLVDESVATGNAVAVDASCVDIVQDAVGDLLARGPVA